MTSHLIIVIMVAATSCAVYDSTQYRSSNHPSTMALCYGLARRILGYTRHTDDRPFTQERKQVLPIRGFKGNRVIYGDISEDEEEDILTKDEPLYSEPVFPLSGYKDGGLSSLDSGYTVSDSQGYYSDYQAEFLSSNPGVTYLTIIARIIIDIAKLNSNFNYNIN